MTGEPSQLDPEALEAFVEEYLQLEQKVQQPEGLYEILSGPREAQYQETLRYFLDPQKPHGFQDTLLEALLERLDVHQHNLSGQHIELETEVQIAEDDSDGRIDLVICGGSALSDHPDWAVFLELKVAAAEGTQQTLSYVQANDWNFSWFDTETLALEKLTDVEYAYLKRASAPGPTAEAFQPIAWRDVVTAFERQLQGSLFDYPNRSVVQLTDFIDSLKQTEHVTSSPS